MSSNFKDLIAWQLSHTYTVEVYRHFNGCRDFSFKEQIQRAAISGMNNIAEGCGRTSDKAFINFLQIAKASIIETQSMLILAVSLQYISDENCQTMLNKSDELLKVISGLIRKLRAKD
ncbi:MAG: four helix bundle protein [bacterium]|nr:four helix bundle protein [bacterium]